jgi:hypothetical protein
MRRLAMIGTAPQRNHGIDAVFKVSKGRVSFINAGIDRRVSGGLPTLGA